MNKPRGKALVSGKFKVIHSGHIRLFKLARELSKELVVALDAFGLDEEDVSWRVQALQNINFVDRVLIYENDIEEVLEKELPEIVVKGSEFAQVLNVEEQILSKWGGRLIFSSGDSFFSERDMIPAKSEGQSRSKPLLPEEFMQRHKISIDRLLELLKSFQGKKVCVIGDLIIDEFINCHPLGMSQEEPTIVVTPIDKKRFLGGAGIVAAHCASLGADTTLMTVRGDDEVGQWSIEMCSEYGFNLFSIVDSTRPTTHKQRFRSGSQTLLKLTHLRQESISSDLEDELIEKCRAIVQASDVVIFSDFSYGVLTARVTEEILKMAKMGRVFVAADSQSSSQMGDLSRFLSCDLITSTEREARLELRDENSGLVILAEKLRSSLDAKHLLLKLGGDGLIIHGMNQSGGLEVTDQVPALNDAFIDASGAGDSLLSTSALCLASQATIYEAALLGSIVAAIQVGRLGNVPVTKSQVLNVLQV
jgi:rfaE bifunctional protein kinase chain/domain